MNESSKLTLQQWLNKSVDELKQAGIITARLDALVLLSDALGKNKAWLLAHLDSPLLPHLAKELNLQVSRRVKREPLAYIRGKQEFYGRDFVVNKHVLIPRPDSEVLIDLLEPLAKESAGTLLDIGTGSGILGITSALEHPRLRVELVDISPDALVLANLNAQRFKLNLPSHVSNLLANWPSQSAQFIVANLPYVDIQWQCSPETAFEPSLALFAKDKGLVLIKRLIKQSRLALKPGGHLILEADPRQHEAIIKFADTHNLNLVGQQGFGLVLKKG